MTVGLVVFGLVFLVGLGLGSILRRPFLTACITLGAFVALIALQTNEPFVAFAAFALVGLGGLLAQTMRDTVGALLGR